MACVELTAEERAAKEALLVEAEAAYHAMATGKAVREFRDQNGETVSFQGLKMTDLDAYIRRLRQELLSCTDQSTAREPMRFFF